MLEYLSTLRDDTGQPIATQALGTIAALLTRAEAAERAVLIYQAEALRATKRATAAERRALIAEDTAAAAPPATLPSRSVRAATVPSSAVYEFPGHEKVCRVCGRLAPPPSAKRHDDLRVCALPSCRQEARRRDNVAKQLRSAARKRLQHIIADSPTGQGVVSQLQSRLSTAPIQAGDSVWPAWYAQYHTPRPSHMVAWFPIAGQHASAASNTEVATSRALRVTVAILIVAPAVFSPAIFAAPGPANTNDLALAMHIVPAATSTSGATATRPITPVPTSRRTPVSATATPTLAPPSYNNCQAGPNSGAKPNYPVWITLIRSLRRSRSRT